MKKLTQTSYTPYPLRKLRRIRAYTSQITTKDLRPNTPYPKDLIRRKHEHEEMEIFITEFRTTNELLLKEQNNLLVELKIEVNKLSKVIGNVLIPRNKVKGVTTRGRNMTSEATPSKEVNETGINKNEPPRLEQDVQEKPHDDGVENKSLSIPERATHPLVDKFVLSINFIILDMPKDSRIPIILGRPFLATTHAMIYVFNKKITLRVGDDEVIFDMDQSMKRPPTEDDE
ncbi:hypothetical protein Tco_1547718 [Tanacetum coccineum]